MVPAWTRKLDLWLASWCMLPPESAFVPAAASFPVFERLHRRRGLAGYSAELILVWERVSFLPFLPEVSSGGCTVMTPPPVPTLAGVQGVVPFPLALVGAAGPAYARLVLVPMLLYPTGRGWCSVIARSVPGWRLPPAFSLTHRSGTPVSGPRPTPCAPFHALCLPCEGPPVPART